MYGDNSNIVRIANPIYDVVFKFLMADNKIAKLLLSTIIGHQIVELQFDPTETTTQVEGAITVLRMDFKATVRYDDGSQQVVIIELQKAKTENDIVEFYNKQKNISKVGNFKNIEIITIVFIEDVLNFAKNIPVIRKANDIINMFNYEKINVTENIFLNVLPKNSIILQMNFDKKLFRTPLEKLLYLFNQGHHRPIEYIKINRLLIPEEIKIIYWKLTEAFASPYLMRQIELECEVVNILKSKHRIIRNFKNKNITK